MRDESVSSALMIEIKSRALFTVRISIHDWSLRRQYIVVLLRVALYRVATKVERERNPTSIVCYLDRYFIQYIEAMDVYFLNKNAENLSGDIWLHSQMLTDEMSISANQIERFHYMYSISTESIGYRYNADKSMFLFCFPLR